MKRIYYTTLLLCLLATIGTPVALADGPSLVFLLAPGQSAKVADGFSVQYRGQPIDWNSQDDLYIKVVPDEGDNCYAFEFNQPNCEGMLVFTNRESGNLARWNADLEHFDYIENEDMWVENRCFRFNSLTLMREIRFHDRTELMFRLWHE